LLLKFFEALLAFFLAEILKVLAILTLPAAALRS